MAPPKIVLTTKSAPEKPMPKTTTVKNRVQKTPAVRSLALNRPSSNETKLKKSTPRKSFFLDEVEVESSDESNPESDGEDEDEEQVSAKELLERYKEMLKLYVDYEEITGCREMANEIFKLQLADLDGYFEILGFSNSESFQNTTGPIDKTIYEGEVGRFRQYNWRRKDYKDVWVTDMMKPHKMETGQLFWALTNIWDILNEIKILSSASKIHPKLPQELREYHAGEFRATRVFLSDYSSECGKAKERSKQLVINWIDEEEGNILWLFEQYLTLRKKLSLGKK